MATRKQPGIDLGQLDPEYKLTIEDLRRDVELGVVPDKLNDRKLFLLFVAGILLVTAMVLFAMELYRYYDFKSSFNAAVAAEYSDLQRLQERHTNELGGTAVLDPDRQIYRIPIDSAITLIVNEAAR